MSDTPNKPFPQYDILYLFQFLFLSIHPALIILFDTNKSYSLRPYGTTYVCNICKALRLSQHPVPITLLLTHITSVLALI